MANLKSKLKILRGSNTNIASNSDILDAGQILYNKDKNYLTVGDGSKPVNALPITVRTVKGNINDTSAISADVAESNTYEFSGDSTGVYIKTDKNFTIKSNNGIELLAVKTSEDIPVIETSVPFMNWYSFITDTTTDVSGTYNKSIYYKFTGKLTSFKPILKTSTNGSEVGISARNNYCDWYIFEFEKTSKLNATNISISNANGVIPFANGWTQNDFTDGRYVIYVLNDIAYVNYI